MKIRLRSEGSVKEPRLGIDVEDGELLTPRDLASALRALRLRPRNAEELLIQLQMHPSPIAREAHLDPKQFARELTTLVVHLKDKIDPELFSKPAEPKFRYGYRVDTD